MTKLIKVAKVNEVSPETIQTVKVNGKCLLLVKIDQQIYALDSRCPHRDGPLDKGRLRGNMIECPWHYYRYDIKTGKNLYPRNVYPADLTYLERDLKPLHHYRVLVEGDEVLVEFKGKQNES